MYAFSIDSGMDKAAFYAELIVAALALTDDEPDPVANMANLSALLWQYVPDLNWAGFYRLVGDELVLGPFQGKPACVRIAVGKGVCGTAVARRRTQCVADVQAFPGHIACDDASRSEIVVPILQGERLIGVMDLDSPVAAHFDASDVAGLEALAAAVAPRLS